MAFFNKPSPDVTQKEFRETLGRLTKLERSSFSADAATVASCANWKTLNPDKHFLMIGAKATMLACYVKAAEQMSLPDDAESRAAVREACKCLGVEVPKQYRKK